MKEMDSRLGQLVARALRAFNSRGRPKLLTSKALKRLRPINVAGRAAKKAATSCIDPGCERLIKVSRVCCFIKAATGGRPWAETSIVQSIRFILRREAGHCLSLGLAAIVASSTVLKARECHNLQTWAYLTRYYVMIVSNIYITLLKKGRKSKTGGCFSYRPRMHGRPVDN